MVAFAGSGLAAVGLPEQVVAQTAPAQGTITGSIRMRTPGATFEGAAVRLIVLRDGEDPEAVELPVPAATEFEFRALADPTVTYLIAVEYDGIQYLSNALLLSPDLPTVTADIEVYATTDAAPALTIEATTVTLLAIDREQFELTLIREDRVRHDEPVVYTGGADGVTLLLPVPDGTLDAGGFDDGAASYSFDGGTVAVAAPLQPGVTSVVTRYTVRYERDEDEYRLRITVPLRSDHIEIRVPERFVREVRPQSEDAARAPNADFQGEPLIVVERTTPAEPGQGLVVDLRGMSGERASNPLTSRSGAAVGAVLALIVVAGTAIGLHRGLPGPRA